MSAKKCLPALLAIGLAILASCATPTRGTSASSSMPQAGSSPAATAQPAREVSGPKAEFGDGTWVVGEDIVAGTYRSPGAKEGIFEFCSVSTYANDTADGNVLAIDTANANEPIRIKVSGKVKSVKASGCEPFVKVA